MTSRIRLALSACILGVFGAVTTASAQIDARMFRYPDVSATHIAFVYAGDIWVVAKSGGLATRLSSPAGEEMFPRFSPDGSRLAFSAAYAGRRADAAHAARHEQDALAVGVPVGSTSCPTAATTSDSTCGR